MKIYNKKSFITGIFLFVLGTLNLVMDLINHTFEIKGIVLILALYFMSGGFIAGKFFTIPIIKYDRVGRFWTLYPKLFFYGLNTFCHTDQLCLIQKTRYKKCRIIRCGPNNHICIFITICCKK